MRTDLYDYRNALAIRLCACKRGMVTTAKAEEISKVSFNHAVHKVTEIINSARTLDELKKSIKDI